MGCPGFANKVYAVFEMARDTETDIPVWMDADSCT